MTAPETRFATVGTDRVAYQVLGDGPRDLVCATGQWSHIDLDWEEPAIAHFYRRLASFSRLIRFDARGSGLSDSRPQDGREAWEHWIDDLLAVMDATGSNSAAIVGIRDSAPLALQFAGTHPERVAALVVLNAFARFTAAPDYPEGHSPEAVEQLVGFTRKYYGTEQYVRAAIPSLANDERALRWHAKWFRAMGSPRAIAESSESLMRMDVRPTLSRIRAPTLVMTRGGNRWQTVAMGRFVAERIAGARFVELPGTDTIWETPDLTLDHIEEFLTGVRRGGESERALAAVLFTDIVDSTGRAAELGDAAWRKLLDRHDQIQREQIARFKGRLVDSAGDGVLATFERPDRAVECAQALIAELNDSGIRIRSGVHFGDTELREDGRLAGLAVHVAARVAAIADAGELLVSRTVQDILLGSSLSFVERGVHALKGVPGDWAVYAVVGSKVHELGIQPGVRTTNR